MWANVSFSSQGDMIIYCNEYPWWFDKFRSKVEKGDSSLELRKKYKHESTATSSNHPKSQDIPYKNYRSVKEHFSVRKGKFKFYDVARTGEQPVWDPKENRYKNTGEIITGGTFYLENSYRNKFHSNVKVYL